MDLRSLAVALVLFCLPAGAPRAHVCHAPAEGLAAAPRGLRFATFVVAADYRGPRYEGSYQGLGTAFAWEHRRVSLSATVMSYRLIRNGAEVLGPGDLLLAAQAPILHVGRLRAGAALMVSLPTGDPQKGLGMGHVMLMPALFATMQAGRLTLGAVAGYAAMLGGQGSHHQGPAPLVDPMNPMEITADARLAIDVHPRLQLHGDLHAALPVALLGEARLVAAVGGHVRLQAFALGLEGQAPLVGSPFSARGVMTVAYHL